jgi:nucleoside-diphosphate-sugar epimerase
MQLKTIAVLGASGVAGRAFVPLARAAGLNVRIERVDIYDLGGLRQQFVDCDAVVNLATAVPKSKGLSSWNANDRLRREGIVNIVEACRSEGVKILVQQSLVMLDCGPPYESASDMEAYLRTVDMDVRVVRGGLFYGLDTGMEERVRSELIQKKGNKSAGQNWLATVHTEDFASAIVFALLRGKRGQLYSACDDVALQWKDIYVRATSYFDLSEQPECGGEFWPNCRASNQSLRLLGWEPKNQFLVK